MQNTLDIYIEEIVQNLTNNSSSQEMSFDLNGIITGILAKLSNLFNLPSMSTIRNIDWSDIEGALKTIGIALIVIFFSCIVMYILKSIGLYKMLKKEKCSFAWISFVPYGSLYAIGKAIGKTKIYGIDISHTEYMLPIILLSSVLPFTCGIPTVLFVLAFFGLLYRLYQKKTPNFAIVLTILSVLFVPLIPLFLFVLRNK